MRMRLGVLLLTALVGCATLGTPITGSNNHLQMPHYSFTVPANQGWHLQRPDDRDVRFERAVITKKAGPFVFRIELIRQTVLSDKVRAMSAKAMADLYRADEVKGMIRLGVNRGLYRLENVAMAEDTIGDKRFYTMTFTTVSSSAVASTVMYLYFPKPEGNSWFIAAGYSEAKSADVATNPTKSFKSDFENVLKTLVVR